MKVKGEEGYPNLFFFSSWFTISWLVCLEVPFIGLVVIVVIVTEGTKSTPRLLTKELVGV